jgi:deazaflavin-dependent oxidoreductase (nitroreductase family)
VLSVDSRRVTDAVEWVLRCRPLVRAPILMYRCGLGSLFGGRILMLEHIGRTTGRKRYVVLEVIARQTPKSYTVASGFGAHAQWLRNVSAEPRVRVSSGRRNSARATARRLTASEADAVLEDYRLHHPKAWRRLKDIVERNLDGRVEPPDTELPMVEFTVE